ncbi:MAG TPA: alginate export family protein [Nitrospiraceae bacterium]|jgi:hypothetical protein|nr:alginate export family protein [Nitrospiraceae bacterium]
MKLLRDGLPIGVIGGIALVTSGALFATTAAQPQRPSEGVAEPEPPAIEEKLRKLEQQGPQPEPQPSESPQPRPKAKALERLKKLEQRREEEKAKELEEQGPKERARQKMQQLKQPTEPAAPPASKVRVKQLLGVYGEVVGIYDEILQKTEPGPGTLYRALKGPAWLVLGGEHRTRYETLDGRFRAGEVGSDQQLALRTRLLFGIQDIFDPVRLTVELQDSRASLTDSGSFVTSNHVNQTDIQQLHIDFVSDNLLGMGLPTELNIGRVNMDLGRGRWVARNNFRNATNAFDGAHWSLGERNRWHLHSFVVWPVEQFHRKADHVFTENPTTLWGAYVQLPPLEWFRAELSYHGHASRREAGDFTMLGARIFKLGGVSRLEFEVETDYQFGNIAPTIGFGHFHHGEFGYTFDLPWTPQLLFKFDYASNGFDTLYGRRSFELMPTGIFGAVQRSNVIYPGYRVLVKPAKRVYLFVQHRPAWLADGRGHWVGTGLQDPTGSAGTFLGHIVELRARWGLTDYAFLQAGFTHFAFGSFPQRAPGSPGASHSNYGYVATEFMF